MRTILLTLCLLSGAATAAPLRVVTDIPPVQGIAAAILDGIAEPNVLIAGADDPHNFSLRPSQAQALQQADVVFWIGPALTPQLEKPLEALSDAQVVALEHLDGVHRLPLRELADFAEVSEGGHGHGEHGDEDQDRGHDDHGHDAHAHGDHADGHDDHAHADHSHSHHGHDPHMWLDPDNAIVWAQHMAKLFTDADPENAAVYEKNLTTFTSAVEEAAAAAKDRSSTETGVLLLHDAIRYFEAATGLKTGGAISDGHATTPGAARIAVLQEKVAQDVFGCVLAERGSSSKLISAIDPQGRLTVVEIDPLGVSLPVDARHYPALLTGLAAAVASCP